MPYAVRARHTTVPPGGALNTAVVVVIDRGSQNARAHMAWLAFPDVCVCVCVWYSFYSLNRGCNHTAHMHQCGYLSGGAHGRVGCISVKDWPSEFGLRQSFPPEGQAFSCSLVLLFSCCPQQQHALKPRGLSRTGSPSMGRLVSVVLIERCDVPSHAGA